MKHKIPELECIRIIFEDNLNVFAFDYRKDIESINRIAKSITACQRGHYIVQLDFDDNQWMNLTIEQFILISDQLIYIDRNFEKEKAKEKQRCQNKSLTQERSRLQR